MSLLDKAKSIVVQSRRPTWFDKLPANQRAEIIELVEAYVRGDLGAGWHVSALAEKVLIPNGINTSPDRLRAFVREYEKNPDAFRANTESAAEGREGGHGSEVERRRQPKGTSKRKP